MRTKALLLTGLLTLAGVVASFAQSNVYSINVVGYVTVTISNDTVYRIISNPLVATNNDLNVLIPSAPPGTLIYKLLPSGIYSISSFDPDLLWDPPNTLAVGEAAFIKLSQPGSFQITFVGEVAQGAASNKQLPAGLSLQGSLVPQAASINNVPGGLSVPGNPGDLLYKLNPNGAYTISSYDPDLGWDPDATIGVAEGFFFRGSAPINWNRNFVVP